MTTADNNRERQMTDTIKTEQALKVAREALDEIAGNSLSTSLAHIASDALRRICALLASVPAAPVQQQGQVSKLVEFFRGEGYTLGTQGDSFGWETEETAIRAMRYLLKLKPKVVIPQIDDECSEEECGNCFDGKSDMDHVCRKCGGSGKAEAAQAAPQQEPLNEAQLDHIARSYFAEQHDQDLVKHAIHDAFMVAATHPRAAQAAPLGSSEGCKKHCLTECMWLGSGPCPHKQAAQPCQHKNSDCVYESDDGEMERHVCRDCGQRFTVEIPQ